VARLPREVVDAPCISVGFQMAVSVILYILLAASAPGIAIHRIPQHGEVSV